MSTGWLKSIVNMSIWPVYFWHLSWSVGHFECRLLDLLHGTFSLLGSHIKISITHITLVLSNLHIHGGYFRIQTVLLQLHEHFLFHRDIVLIRK